MDKALGRLELLLDSDDDSCAARAVREGFDRVLGRSNATHEHSGLVAVEIQCRPEQLCATLADLRARRDARAERTAS